MSVPPISNVDLKLLRVFMTVVRSGGFSLAQAELNVSQATISIHIKSLETRLGLILCQRGRAGFSLTEDGQRTYQAACALFNHLDDFRCQVLGEEKLVGELQIAVIDNTIAHPSFKLSETIRQFGELNHEVHITVYVAAPNRLEQMVLSGEAHLGIGFFPRQLSQLDYHPAFISNMEMYCSNEHTLFDKDNSTIKISDIEEAEHAQRGYVSIDQIPGNHKPFNFTARAHHVEGLAHLVLSGQYLAFLPNHYAEPLIAIGLLKSIRPDIYAYQSKYEIIRRKSSVETPAASKFYELLKASCIL